METMFSAIAIAMKPFKIWPDLKCANVTVSETKGL